MMRTWVGSAKHLAIKTGIVDEFNGVVDKLEVLIILHIEFNNIVETETTSAPRSGPRFMHASI
jgi:hypothetical protein